MTEPTSIPNIRELPRSPNTLAADLRKLADGLDRGEVSGHSAVVLLLGADDSRPPTSAVVGAPVDRFRLVGALTAFIHVLLGAR